MTATAPIEPDVDLIDHLDPTTPCTIGVVVQLTGTNDRSAVAGDPCPNPATWDMTCRRCAATSPICDKHKHDASGAVAGRCRRCKANGRPARLFTFYRIGADA